jgi:hypothetical protein
MQSCQLSKITPVPLLIKGERKLVRHRIKQPFPLTVPVAIRLSPFEKGGKGGFNKHKKPGV